MPYLNERNVVANVPISDVVWDHPDREANPLAGGPGEMIFSKADFKEESALDRGTEQLFFNKEAFLDTDAREKQTSGAKQGAQNVFAQRASEKSNYLEMLKAESQKNVALQNQNQELRVLLEKKNVGGGPEPNWRPQD